MNFIKSGLVHLAFSELSIINFGMSRLKFKIGQPTVEFGETA